DHLCRPTTTCVALVFLWSPGTHITWLDAAPGAIVSHWTGLPGQMWGVLTRRTGRESSALDAPGCQDAERLKLAAPCSTAAGRSPAGSSSVRRGQRVQYPLLP